MVENQKRTMRIVDVSVNSKNRTYAIVLTLKDLICYEMIILPTIAVPGKIHNSDLLKSMNLSKPLELEDKEVNLYSIDGHMLAIGPADKDEVLPLYWSPFKTYTEEDFWLEANTLWNAEEFIREHGGDVSYV